MKAISAACLIVFTLGFLTSAMALSPGEYTIVALGDSTTADRFVDGRWLNVYCDLLRDELPAYGITGSVINKGVPGDTSSNALARFDSDVMAQNPDLAILHLGINDAAVDVWKDPPATQPRVSLDQYITNMTTMVHTLKSNSSQVVLMTPNPWLWTDQFRDYYGKPPYDVNDPMGLNVIIPDYVQAVKDLAARESLPVVDVYSLFLAYGQTPGNNINDLYVDGIHPNDLGHRLVATALESVLAPSQPQLATLNSTQFDHRYEADTATPDIEDPSSGWTLTDTGAAGDPFSAADGILHLATVVEGGGRWYSGTAFENAIDPSTSYTLEFRAKITDSSGTEPGLNIVLANGEDFGWLSLGSGSLDWMGKGTIMALDNASAFHTFRIAFDADSSTFTLWRDGILLGKNLSPIADPGLNGIKRLVIGDASSGCSGTVDIDYIRWDTGGIYAPVPEPVSMILFVFGALFLRRNNLVQ